MFDEESMQHLERLHQESELTGMAAHISIQIIGPAPALEEIKIRAMITHVCSEVVGRAAAAGLSPATIKELMSLEGVLENAQYQPEHPDLSGSVDSESSADSESPKDSQDTDQGEQGPELDMDPGLIQALEELSRDMEKMMDPAAESDQTPEPQRIEIEGGVGFMNHIEASSEFGVDPMQLFRTVRRTLEAVEAAGAEEPPQDDQEDSDRP